MPTYVIRIFQFKRVLKTSSHTYCRILDNIRFQACPTENTSSINGNYRSCGILDKIRCSCDLDRAKITCSWIPRMKFFWIKNRGTAPEYFHFSELENWNCYVSVDWEVKCSRWVGLSSSVVMSQWIWHCI